MSRVFHIVTQQEAERAAREGHYRPASLAKEGFIHCSYLHQLCRVANFLFQGQSDLIILEIDSAQIASKVIAEDLYESGELFPHIYGELPWKAVIALHPFLADAKGYFLLPGTLG